MKILITGGKGFIGSKMVEMLCKEHDITIIDNEDTYGIMSKTELEKVERNYATEAGQRETR